MSTEGTILKQLSKGSQLAFRQLYDIHSEPVYRLAIYILREIKCAEEIVQDTFMQVWDKREELDCEGNIATYLHVICRNKSFNKLKQINRQKKLFDPIEDDLMVADPSFHDSFTSKELEETLETIIKRLPDRQQIIFRLCRIEGRSHKEIAESLHVSVQTVKNQMVTALKFVRSELQNKGDMHFIIILSQLFFI